MMQFIRKNYALKGGSNMLSIEEILKMSEEMGIEIENGTSGKHYILDEFGEEIEFNTDIIIGQRKETVSYEIDSETFKVNLDKSNSLYDFSSSDNPYGSIPAFVKESIINAAQKA